MATHEQRVAALSRTLPKTRAIGQGVFRDPAGRVLLCELTYKDTLDLPGGIVEPDESPLAGLRREVREEFGIEVGAASLLAVNWLPAWGGWDDAVVFLFDLGEHPVDLPERLTLEEREIRGVRWCTRDEVRERATAVAATMLETVLWTPGRGVPVYLEAGVPTGQG